MNNRFIDWSDDRKFRAGYDAGYTNGYEDGYKAAKAESRAPVWTPCSEGLPEKDGKYLVCVETITGTRVVFVHQFRYGKFDGFGGVILAWMPLAEPYRGEA